MNQHNHPTLTPEQEQRIGDQLADMLHDGGDDLAIELGIPPRDVRPWTDEEIEIIWAEIEGRWRSDFIAEMLSPDAG